MRRIGHAGQGSAQILRPDKFTPSLTGLLFYGLDMKVRAETTDSPPEGYP